MSTISLDSIRQAADAKYGSYDIELPDGTVAKLLNPMRLSETARKALMSIGTDLTETSDDDSETSQVEVFERVITLVCETPAQAKKLLAAVNHDLAMLAEIFSGYGSGTQMGEASASAA